MKKIIGTALIILLYSLFLSALFADGATKPVQIFMPETACVGDTAELRYLFHSDANLIGGENMHLELPTDIPAFAAQREKCEVLSAALDRAGDEYTLSLSLIGWQVGQIDFAPFAIGSYTVDFEPITIHSVVERTGATGFRPPSPPLVVPGTTALLALIAVLFLLLLATVIFALLHIPAITDFLTQTRAERIARRNMRVALKKLRTLAATMDTSADGVFCAKIQHILRGYLSKRFSYPFATVETSDLYATVSDICGGDLTDAQDAMVQELLYVFNRTDYIRYAHAALNTGEKEILLSAAVDAVQSIGR